MSIKISEKENKLEVSLFELLHNLWYNAEGYSEKHLKNVFVPKISKLFFPKIVYKCQYCGKSIVRPINEGELIMQGKTLCECGQYIIYFKVIYHGSM